MSFSFGKKFRITVFGESHGECIGTVVEGCPPGHTIDMKAIQIELDRRKPGQSDLTTLRKESDDVEILSGLLNGKTTGAPITILVKNKDVDSSYYEKVKNKPRPGHADFTARKKYRGFNDYRGGGVLSGRMTAAFVMAGAIAKQILVEEEIKVLVHIVQIGKIKLIKEIKNIEIERNVYTNDVRCADLETARAMKQEIIKAREGGDSVGGLIECRVLGLPVGIGEPLFDSIESVLSHAIFSIPAVKGIEFGSGFRCVELKGSVHNDPFIIKEGEVITSTNNAGGILGGISNGMPIVFRVAIKPTSSILRPQSTVNLETMKECKLEIKGRHDPCIAIRAVPVVESVTTISLVDLLMMRHK